jgi:hypothetical protein
VPKGDARGSPGGRAERRPLIVALVVAIVLHLPLLPLRISAWMRVLLDDSEEAEELDGEAIIPIDLDLDLGAGAEPAGGAASVPEPTGDVVAATEPAPPPPKKKPEPKREPEPKDAGVDAPSGELEDAGAPVADASAASDPYDELEKERDAGAPKDGGVADAGADAGPGGRDPLELAGDGAKIAAQHANVQLLLAGEPLRKHELGPRFGALLTSVPQWRAFFQGSGMDPIHDVDLMLITGPQFRDTRQVVASLFYSGPPARVRSAIDRLLAASDPKGEWLKDTPVPTAKGMVDRRERLFAHAAQKKLLVVLPPEAKPQLARVPAMKRPSVPGAAIVASTIAPARALREVPMKIPASLQKLVVQVVPTSDGGADVLLDATDASAAEAEKNAEELFVQIDAVRVVPLLKIELFSNFQMKADGAKIRGSAHVPISTIKLVLGHFEAVVAQRDRIEGAAGKP